MNETSKERGEAGKSYYIRNASGRAQALIRCEPARADLVQVASFPGSPHALTKVERRGEPSKIYHVRNGLRLERCHNGASEQLSTAADTGE